MCGFIAQLVEHRGGHGFEFRWSPDFFRILLSNCSNWKSTAMIILHIQSETLLFGLPKGSPGLKISFVFFFCLQTQIAFWVLKRIRAFLLSLRMRMINEHAQTHVVEKMVDLHPCPLKGAWILWFLLRSSHIQMHTPGVNNRQRVKFTPVKYNA